MCITNSVGCSHYCDVSDGDSTLCSCPIDYNRSANGSICTCEYLLLVCDRLWYSTVALAYEAFVLESCGCILYLV